MKITIAEHAGFCFGVRRATDTLEKEISAGGDRKIYTLGRIIHNDKYIEGIKSRGVEEIARGDIPDVISRADSGEKITVIIRAHGEIASVVESLEACAGRNPEFHLLDCTCPYVRKVRDIVRDNTGEGKHIYLIGDANHPEVEGIMSCAKGPGTVLAGSQSVTEFFSDPLNILPEGTAVSVAAQTTQNLSEWEKSINIFKKLYTNSRIFDTICSVTETRQNEAAALAADSDIMIVIGSPDSSNSCKLRDISRMKCDSVYFIGDAKDCPKVTGDLKVSITAGASTPSSLIQEVYTTMNEQVENFAELLESSLKTLNTGEIVEGVVTSVSQNEIHLDLGTKTTGVIVHDKATNDPQAKLADLFKVGDVVKAKVVKVSDIDGIATLDKTRVDSEANWDNIVAAYDSQEILEAKIAEVVKGGVIGVIDSVRVFIPASLTGVPKDGDLQTLVGTTQRVKVIEIKPERRRAFASIRAVLREERKAKQEELWASLAEGQEFDGEVKSLTSFGAFVDLGGVDGMVHVSELSWKRVRDPKEVVSVGDKIHVFVKAVDREKRRISLGCKTDDTNPWTLFTNQYAEGDVADVKIVSLLPFGAFAEILPGCDGLIHISQIADHKIAKPEEVLEVGQTVAAKITAIDNEKHKVSLSIRALLAPEEAEEAVEENVEEAAEAVAEEVAEAADAE